MHKLQHSFGQRDAKRPVRKILELPFGPGWVVPPGALEKLRREQGRNQYDQPAVPLQLPLEEPPIRRTPSTETPQRGVFILEL